MNRRQRRTLKTEGFALHWYSGEDSGHTLQRSMRCQGSKTKRLLEVDVKKGQAYDMLADEGIYATLLRAALSGKILAILGGPNCRSRSVLRHRPIEGQPWAPRPVRCWEGGEFGAHWINKKEKKMIQEDDTLLWRMIFLLHDFRVCPQGTVATRSCSFCFGATCISKVLPTCNCVVLGHH